MHDTRRTTLPHPARRTLRYKLVLVLYLEQLERGASNVTLRLWQVTAIVCPQKLMWGAVGGGLGR